MTLLELQQCVSRLVAVPDTRDVWVRAELSDVACRGGHCYMELIQKDDAGTVTLAKARGVIWSNTYRDIAPRFRAATGRDLAGGLKVLARVTASFHPVYGYSLVVSEIDPSYTMGDLLRVRREILERLGREGILEQNRSLEWPPTVTNVAVISAPGAAGYGDFINQLLGNSSHLRFNVRLFQAVMQGEKAPASIIEALRAVALDTSVDWDCVVIIRGGGATSDLAAFENYELAANVALMPVPVIVGIGHERDVTVLDYVANRRVKTPTAAAAFLIERGEAALASLRDIAQRIALSATDALNGASARLAYFEGLLPVIPVQGVERARARLLALTSALGSVSGRIPSMLARLDACGEAVATAAGAVVERRRARLDALQQLVDALSPEATLRRGYSITRIGGHAVTSAADVAPGSRVETILASGSFTSTVN